MVELGLSQTGPASAIATEIDLAKLWWRYGGGRREDAGRLARLKGLGASGVLRACHHLRQLGDVGGDAPGLVADEELGGRCWYVRAAQHARGQLHRCRARLVVN